MIYLFWFMDYPHILLLSPTLPHYFQKFWLHGKTQNCAGGHIVHWSAQDLLDVLTHLDQSSHCHWLLYLWGIPRTYSPIICISPFFNPPFQTSIHLIQWYQGPSYQDPHHQHYINTKYTSILCKWPEVYNIDSSVVSTHSIPRWNFLDFLKFT